MAETLAEMQVIKDTADSGKMAYDQMLAADNAEGNAMIQARGRLRWSPRPGRSRRVVAALDLKHRGRGLRQPRQPGRGPERSSPMP